jgi:hypothetical protein
MNSFTGNNNNTMGGAGHSNPLTSGTSGTQGAAGDHRDVGDKVFDSVAKKSGHNVGPSTGEKITDGARGLFEKATGLVIPLIALLWLTTLANTSYLNSKPVNSKISQ